MTNDPKYSEMFNLVKYAAEIAEREGSGIEFCRAMLDVYSQYSYHLVGIDATLVQIDGVRTHIAKDKAAFHDKGNHA